MNKNTHTKRRRKVKLYRFERLLTFARTGVRMAEPDGLQTAQCVSYRRRKPFHIPWHLAVGTAV